MELDKLHLRDIKDTYPYDYDIKVLPLITPVGGFPKINLDIYTHSGKILNETFIREYVERWIINNRNLHKFLPQPFNPDLTADDIKSKKFKIREILDVPISMSSIEFASVLTDVFMEANKLYNFELLTIGSIKLVKVPHTDNNPNWFWDLDKSPSKLTLIQELSDPSEYEGGDYEILMGNEIKTIIKEQYSCTIFPSFCMQRITPITKGTKYYVIATINGKNFM